MLVPAPHSSWVSVIVRFEHFESVPVWILGTGTEISNSNLPKQLATHHWFLHYLQGVDSPKADGKIPPTFEE
jgi:hypothetical protein